MFSVETGQMSAVETGRMSAAEAGQMSAVGRRQMSSVARADICLVSTHNVQVLGGGLALNPQKWPEWLQNGRQVLRIRPWACHGRSLGSGMGPAAPGPP